MAELGESSKKNRVWGTVLFSALILAIMALVPYTVGLSRGGFSIDGIKNQYLMYLPIGAVSWLIVMLLYFYERGIKQGDVIYGDGLGFDSPGQIPHWDFRWFDNRVRLALACIIFFSVLGLIANVNQQTFTGIGGVQEQFTKFDNALFAGSLVAASENLGSAAVLALVLVSLRRYARKSKMSRQNFQILAWTVGIVAVGLYGLVNHISRYSSQDVALTTVFLFWAFGGLITMITGSFIPFWIAHITNNVFFDLGKSLAAETTYIYVVGFIALMSILYAYLYFFRKKKEG